MSKSLCSYCVQSSKGFCDVLQWHKRLLMSKSLSRKYGSNTQVRMMEETAHTHAKTRQSLACKCDFSLRLVCFAFEFTKQLAAMRNEKTQDETGKKKRGKGKMSTQTELKRRRIDSKRRKKKQIGTAENSVTSFFISARTVG